MSERSLERWMHMLPCGARARKDYEALQAENAALKRAALALSKSKFNERDGHFKVSAELMNKLDELLR